MADRSKQIASAILASALAFQANVDGWTISGDRRYYDDANLSDATVYLTAYPLTSRKENGGKNRVEVIETYYLAIEAKVKKSDTDRIDKLIDYRERLGDHFENAGNMAGAVHVVNTDEQFLWMPDFLHSKGRFVSLLALDYVTSKSKGN